MLFFSSHWVGHASKPHIRGPDSVGVRVGSFVGVIVAVEVNVGVDDGEGEGVIVGGKTKGITWGDKNMAIKLPTAVIKVAIAVRTPGSVSKNFLSGLLLVLCFGFAIVIFPM